MKKTLAVGIVGCGPIARLRHIPSFQKTSPDARIQAVCDLDPKLAKHTADRFGIPSSFSTLSEMVRNCDLDVIDVCTPPKTHKDVTIEAMENGCHVIAEKPLAVSLADCDAMIRTSEEQDVKLSVVHNQRFYPPFLRAEAMARNGTIGDFVGMRVVNLTHQEGYLQKKNHWIHQLPGGVVEESGPHAIYMSLPFIGRVRGVKAWPSKTLRYPWVSFDTCLINLEGETGSSSIVISHASDYFATEVDLFGTKRMIRLDLQSMLLDLQERKSLGYASLAGTSLRTSSRIGRGVLSNAISTIFGKNFLGHEVVIKRFIRCVRDDSQPPVSLDEARETTRVMEQISLLCAEFMAVIGSAESSIVSNLNTIPVDTSKEAHHSLQNSGGFQ